MIYEIVFQLAELNCHGNHLFLLMIDKNESINTSITYRKGGFFNSFVVSFGLENNGCNTFFVSWTATSKSESPVSFMSIPSPPTICGLSNFFLVFRNDVQLKLLKCRRVSENLKIEIPKLQIKIEKMSYEK